MELVHAYLNFTGNCAQAFRFYRTAGGRVTMPIANAPWGRNFGMCDRFDVQWVVSLPNPV
jgi:uncharacterized glyoxalase superfamily protein PhnB